MGGFGVFGGHLEDLGLFWGVGGFLRGIGVFSGGVGNFFVGLGVFFEKFGGWGSLWGFRRTFIFWELLWVVDGGFLRGLGLSGALRIISRIVIFWRTFLGGLGGLWVVEDSWGGHWGFFGGVGGSLGDWGYLGGVLRSFGELGHLILRGFRAIYGPGGGYGFLGGSGTLGFV